MARRVPALLVITVCVILAACDRAPSAAANERYRAIRSDPLLRIPLDGKPLSLSANAAGSLTNGSAEFGASRLWTLRTADQAVFEDALRKATDIGVVFDSLLCAPHLIASGSKVIDGSFGSVVIGLTTTLPPQLRIQLGLPRGVPSDATLGEPDNPLIEDSCSDAIVSAAGMHRS